MFSDCIFEFIVTWIPSVWRGSDMVLWSREGSSTNSISVFIIQNSRLHKLCKIQQLEFNYVFPVITWQHRKFEIDDSFVQTLIAASEASDTKTYASVGGGTAWEMLAARTIFKTWFFRNYRYLAEYGQKGKAALSFLYKLASLRLSLNEIFSTRSWKKRGQTKEEM